MIRRKALFPLGLAIILFAVAWKIRPRISVEEATAKIESELERHSGLVSLSLLLDATGSLDDAREALNDVAASNEQVVFDGDSRVCLLEPIYHVRNGVRRLDSFELLDLATEENWHRPSLWTGPDEQAEILDARFQKSHLVVSWQDGDGKGRVTTIRWLPGDIPPSGNLK